MELNCEYVPFENLFVWSKKSTIGSQEGKDFGEYKLFIASGTKVKRFDNYIESGEALVFGTGGNPCIHYVNERFSYTNHTEVAKSKRSDICVKFYYYYFQNNNFEKLQSTFVGGGIKNSSKNKIGKLLVPILPLKEQEKIVLKIETLFSKLDNSVFELQLAKEKLNIYRQAVLKEAFSSIDELSELGKISNSRLGKMLDKSKNQGIYRQYLRNINVRWFSFDLSELFEMKIEDSEKEKYLIKKGDLVICEGGEPGRCAVWEKEETIFFQKALHRVRFNQNFNANFYMYYFAFLAQTGEITKYFTGMGIKHLTGQSLSKIRVPNISIEKQNAIVEDIERKYNFCDNNEKNINNTLQKLELLRQSILKEAFEGSVQ